MTGRGLRSELIQKSGAGVRNAFRLDTGQREDIERVFDVKRQHPLT